MRSVEGHQQEQDGDVGSLEPPKANTGNRAHWKHLGASNWATRETNLKSGSPAGGNSDG
jgi:hypothetical protein